MPSFVLLKQNTTIVKDLDGVMNIADDVLVFGVGKE